MNFLITGHTGFLGSTVITALKKGIVEYLTLGRDEKADIKCDLSKAIPIIPSDLKISSVFHIAGKAHSVPKTDVQKKEFFDVNEKGTQHLLSGLESLDQLPKQFVFISTVAVYNCEEGENISVNDINPSDFTHGKATPYAHSKWNAEQLVLNWCKTRNINALILRIPLIFGENAPGNLGAMEKAIRKGYYFSVGSGQAKRSLVYLRDLVKLLTSLNGTESGIFNVISANKSYQEIENHFAHKYNKRIKRIPSFIIKIAAKVGDVFPLIPINSCRLSKLEKSLTFQNNWPWLGLNKQG